MLGNNSLHNLSPSSVCSGSLTHSTSSHCRSGMTRLTSPTTPPPHQVNQLILPFGAHFPADYVEYNVTGLGATYPLGACHPSPPHCLCATTAPCQSLLLVLRAHHHS
jgi:hypothetical protein